MFSPTLHEDILIGSKQRRKFENHLSGREEERDLLNSTVEKMVQDKVVFWLKLPAITYSFNRVA